MNVYRIHNDFLLLTLYNMVMVMWTGLYQHLMIKYCGVKPEI